MPRDRVNPLGEVRTDGTAGRRRETMELGLAHFME